MSRLSGRVICSIRDDAVNGVHLLLHLRHGLALDDRPAGKQLSARLPTQLEVLEIQPAVALHEEVAPESSGEIVETRNPVECRVLEHLTAIADRNAHHHDPVESLLAN